MAGSSDVGKTGVPEAAIGNDQVEAKRSDEQAEGNLKNYLAASEESGTLIDTRSDSKRQGRFSDNLSIQLEDPGDTSTLASTDGVLEVPNSDLDYVKKTSFSHGTFDLKNFMRACQEGDLQCVRDLITEGHIGANDTLEDGITGLHWAAINNRLSVVKYLIENDRSKSDPNIKGGELEATPLHWACHIGALYIVAYLIRYGKADPSLKDRQDYNALQIAIHSSNILLIVYLLFKFCNDQRVLIKSLNVDETDSHGRTNLHWAAYQGDYFSVKALLRFGADVNKRDEVGFIPLHWAFMKSQKNIIKVLIKAESDIFATNTEGKSSFDISKDVHCYPVFLDALKECRRSPNENWQVQPPQINPKFAKMITLLTPFITLPMICKICSFGSGLVIPKLFISSIIFLVSVFMQRYIIPNYDSDEPLLGKSPFFAGILASGIFWCFLIWSFKIIPLIISQHFLLVAVGSLSILLWIWSFYKLANLNPGIIPSLNDNDIILGQIEDLLDDGKYDFDHFSIENYLKKPIRSAYSRITNKLIAKYDHYCPWVYNEIGVRNHKLFVLFLYLLILIIVIFVHTSMIYFAKLERAYLNDTSDRNIKSSFWQTLCFAYRYYHFHANFVIFDFINFVWISLLSFLQTFQILRGITTWEANQILRSKKKNKRATLSVGPRSLQNICSRGSKLFGLDQFKSTLGPALNERSTNLEEHSFHENSSIKTNCTDFWFLGDVSFRNLTYLPIEGENSYHGRVIDYYRQYEYPQAV